MRALDTNVLVRLFVGDDPAQLAEAERLIAEPAFIPLTVLLETAWVLRSRYKLRPVAIVPAFNRLLHAAELTLEAAEHVPWLIGRVAAGADVADMIHLIASRHAVGFVTFDRDLARHADGAPVPVTLAG